MEIKLFYASHDRFADSITTIRSAFQQTVRNNDDLLHSLNGLTALLYIQDHSEAVLSHLGGTYTFTLCIKGCTMSQLGWVFMEITKDSIFNGMIGLYQPKYGYRVAIDPVILANIVEIRKNQTILDVGCGVGTISLILKYFEKSQLITSVDVDRTMTDLCRRNSELNDLPLNVINKKIDSNLLIDKSFDCVITNPPFYDLNSFRSSEKKFIANFETMDIESWISFCIKRLKNRGNFYIIHIPEKLSAILLALEGLVGKIEIIPVYSHSNQSAKRIVIRCKKGSREPLKILPGIVSHQENNEYTDLLKSILDGNFSEADWIKSK